MVLENFTWINKSYSYDDYKELVISNAKNSTTTGKEQLEERIEATKINAQRMIRIDKQTQIKQELVDVVAKLKQKWMWVVLVESWCGDAAQNLPIISKIASLSPNIEFKVILRDQNLELMDAHLANGNRSIPKLICYNSDNGNEIGTWGSRPQNIQEKVNEFKANNPNCTHDELVRNIHYNYAKDKGDSVQEEFIALISKWLA